MPSSSSNRSACSPKKWVPESKSARSLGVNENLLPTCKRLLAEPNDGEVSESH